MNSQTESVAESYNRWAENYDDYEVNNQSLARVRNEIYKHVFTFLQSEDRILEINAGTGTDAQYFAQHGYRIHATDLSPKMVNKIDVKIKQFNLSKLMTSQQLSFTDLDILEHNAYQYCFSNIGGLNCIPYIHEVAKNISLVLSPGGVVTMVIMSRICPWEWMEIFRGNY
ncbi:MAG: class I SAM-dependent methyltransferase, partial [Chloroflexi bacterium]|nr:class I SAM-dependent methyltransferase [Chloroflexota bacterium]